MATKTDTPSSLIQPPPSWETLWQCPKCHHNSLNIDDHGNYCLSFECDYILDSEEGDGDINDDSNA